MRGHNLCVAIPGTSLAALAKAVAAKRLTEGAERLLERLSKHVDRLVAKTFPANDF